MFINDHAGIENKKELIQKENLKIETIAFIEPARTQSDDELIDFLISEYSSIDSLHGPFVGLKFSSSNRDIVNRTYSEYGKYHKIAEKLDCNCIIVHSNFDSDKDDLNQALTTAINFWKTYLAEHNDIFYYVENVAEKDWQFQKQLYDGVRSDKLGLCLDTGHANKNSVTSVEEWVKNLKNRIGHVHLHNNFGDRDEHNGLHEGSINMTNVLQMLVEVAPNAEWCLETSEIPESLTLAKAIKGVVQD